MTAGGIANKIIEDSSHNSQSIPEGVVDPGAWEKYQALSKQLGEIYDNYCRIKTSVAGVYVNIKVAKPQWERYRQYIPEEEFEKYCKYRSRAASIKGKANHQKSLAYGKKGRFQKDDDCVELSHKMLGSKFPELIDLFGRFYTVKEVHEVVRKKWNLDISINSINKIYRDNIDDIKRRRDVYSNDYSHVRLGHKRSRLDELSYLYKRRKDIFESKGYKISDSKEMRALLEQIRKEFEGDRITIDADIKIKQEKVVEMHVHEMIMSGISIKQILIGRAASRLGMPSDLLMERLMTSYYSKYTGYAKPTRQEDNNEKIYPSKILYDFEEVVEKSENNLITSKEVPPLNDKDTEKYSDIKTSIIRRIIDKKKQITPEVGVGRDAIDGVDNTDKI